MSEISCDVSGAGRKNNLIRTRTERGRKNTKANTRRKDIIPVHRRHQILLLRAVTDIVIIIRNIRSTGNEVAAKIRKIIIGATLPHVIDITTTIVTVTRSIDHEVDLVTTILSDRVAPPLQGFLLFLAGSV